MIKQWGCQLTHQLLLRMPVCCPDETIQLSLHTVAVKIAAQSRMKEKSKRHKITINNLL